MRNGVRGQSRPFLGTGLITAEGGVIVPDPAGRPKVMTFAELATALGTSGGGGSFCYVPMSTGAEPLEIMSNGNGEVLLIGYTP